MVRAYCFLGVVLFASLLASCKAPPPPPERRPAVPVTTAKAVRKSVPVELRVIGNVEAYSIISVKAQVGGELVRVLFKEGQEVRKGDPLFQIDPRPYELALQQAETALARDLAQVQQAEANLARDTARSKNADAQASRAAQLATEGVISKEQNDEFRTTAAAQREAARAGRAALEAARAAVNADRVALEKAKLDLGYCLIRSPIDGRTGDLQVNEGNLVKANADSPLVTINQTRPVHVAFSVPERHLPDIRRYMAVRPLPVEAVAAGEPASRGNLAFIDNTVNTTTGTVRLKATFPNPEGRLWPGQFVDVVLTLATQQDVIVVPSEAVQTGQQGQYVFVVKSNQTVESRSVSIGRAAGREIVIASGLQPDETVVTDGHLRLVPGAIVKVVPASSEVSAR